MRLSPVEITAAEKMQRFVAGYEKRGNPARVLGWCVVPILPQVFVAHDRTTRMVFVLAVALQFGVVALYAWMRRRRFEREKPVVTALEREHADELPWVELRRSEVDVEKHLAELSCLQREIGRETVQR
jgi:hypothetical protein